MQRFGRVDQFQETVYFVTLLLSADFYPGPDDVVDAEFSEVDENKG